MALVKIAQMSCAAYNFYKEAPRELLDLIIQFAENAFDVERAETTAQVAFQYYDTDPEIDTHRHALYLGELNEGSHCWSDLMFFHVCSRLQECLTGYDITGQHVDMQLAPDEQQDYLADDIAEAISTRMAYNWAQEARRDALRGLDAIMQEVAFFGFESFPYQHGMQRSRSLAIYAECWHEAKCRLMSTTMARRIELALLYAINNSLDYPEWL